MKIGREVSHAEMVARFPGLMDALKADNEHLENVIYCPVCDGLRLKEHECVPLAPVTEKT